MMRWFWDSYAPDPETRALPTVSPLRASLDRLAGLPTYIGTIHTFMAMNALADTQATRSAIRLAKRRLREALA